MNIFVVDQNPLLAARMLCDKHVVKMPLETAQMLSTVLGGPYKPTHASHPCTVWVGERRDNFVWLALHGIALCEEYTLRYGRTHKCEPIIRTALGLAHRLPRGGTPFAQCMPPVFKHPACPVTAYRRYYHSKAAFAAWARGTPAPAWWQPTTVGEQTV